MNLPTQDAPSDDPYLWLEEIDSPDALAWTEAQNRRTVARLCDDEFAQDRETLQRLMESDDRIPRITQVGDFVYNFWTDAAHPRGLWRRTTLEDYRRTHPGWDVLLDVDALGRAEGESWVFHGADICPDAHDRALISLSPGGTDAACVREFDLESRMFVAGGFALPVSKSSAEWLDADTLLIGPAYDGDVTTSGYPRTIRRLGRGMELADAAIVFEAQTGDMAAGAAVSSDPARRFITYTRIIEFWRRITYYEPRGGDRVRLDLPEDAGAEIAHGRLLVSPRTDWAVAGETYPAGGLLVIALDLFLAGGRSFTPLFTPSPRIALQHWTSLASGVVLTTLDNVTSRLTFLDAAQDWQEIPMLGVPLTSSISVRKLAQGAPESEVLLFGAEGFLTPSTLLLGDASGAHEVLKSLPAQFDATGLAVEQLMATADDGTAIPYFLIGPAAPAADAPVYLYGYGGFEVSLTPFYAAQAGAVWAPRGGRLAIANIRGGGEFGPAWHHAGMRAGKRVAQDDFAAVAADIAGRGIAAPARILGAGGSNGGLLIGNMLTRHPQRFGALICTVPLLDMRRYTKLLAGASWIAEYGDPDEPADWAFLRQISAYHLVEPGQLYPPILIATTRRDDRVHPGHARKMAARLQALGYDALYYEQAEGGHGHGADAGQRAFFVALEYAFARLTVGNHTP
jgi:prolyl oligopeptidase